MNTNQGPLIVVVGPTASGKTKFSLELAKKINAEIIAADSKTIYRRLDIGSAKPTLAERSEVPHFMLDQLNPGDPYSVANFKRSTDNIINSVLSRNKIPLLVGGSGLYVDSVIFDYGFEGPPNERDRAYFNTLTVQDLQNEIIKRGVALPVNRQNKRHLIRTLELGHPPAKKDKKLRPNTLVLGIEPPKEELLSRITERTHKMLEAGLLDEIKKLRNSYSNELLENSGNAYRAFLPYLCGSITLEEAIQTNILLDKHLAKRQMTWFRRNSNIVWGWDSKLLEKEVQKFLYTV